MRKTHGKKQTRKNKTKRRAIRGGSNGKGYTGYKNYQSYGRTGKGTGSNYQGEHIVYKKVMYTPDNKEEDTHNLTQEQQQNLNTRRSRRNRETSKSTASEHLQQNP